jgi:protein O-GlcNAc transferase
VDTADAQVSALVESTPSPEILHLAALIDATQGRHPAAVERLQRAIAAEPLQALWHCDLGSALLATQQPAAANSAFEAALSLNPQLARAWRGAAFALAALGRSEDAWGALRHSLKLDPTSASAHRFAAAVHRTAEAFDLARRHEAEALRANPADWAGRARLALDCWLAEDLSGALLHASAVVSAGAATSAFHGVFLYLLLFHPAQNGASLRAAHEDWASRWLPDPPPFVPAALADPGRRLRIGYLSAEFFGGPPVFFLAPLLAGHNREQFEIFLYHASPRQDEHTEWFRSQACHWCECHALSDEALLHRIRRDQIDILLDPSGYSADHRLTVFAQRAAPLQIAYPSYPCTRGIAAFDFILTDQWATPPGTESQYTEKPVRLPSGYLSYVPPPDAPPVTPLPALRNNFPTFGMFQRRTKLNPPMFDALAQILRQHPGAHLLIQHGDPTLDNPASPSRHNLVREFLLRGIPESRIRYFGARPRAGVMALMAETDVILDTFPFAGQTTTCESLWMGVPVVSLAGDTHPSRVGASLLASAGLTSCVAHSPEEYVAIALRLASDLPYLACLRQELRERLVASGFVASGRLASETEAALRRIWSQWCLNQL